MLVAEWEPEPLAPRSVDIKGLSEDSAPEVSGYFVWSEVCGAELLDSQTWRWS